MALYIFTTSKDFSVELIREEATKQSLDCFVYFYADLVFKRNILVYKDKQSIQIGRKDRIILRDPYQEGNFSLLLKKILKKFKGNILLDSQCLTSYPSYEDKLFQAKFFRKNKICIPKTCYGKQISKISSFPIIVKKRISSRGKGNILLKNSKELNEFLNFRDIRQYIAQEYQKAETDYRILILKEKVLGIVNRKVKFKRDKSIKVKVQKGLNKLPSQVTKDALKISKKLGADFVGIDVLLSQGKYYFLEANLSPQFKGFVRATGINVAKKIIKLV